MGLTTEATLEPQIATPKAKKKPLVAAASSAKPRGTGGAEKINKHNDSSSGNLNTSVDAVPARPRPSVAFAQPNGIGDGLSFSGPLSASGTLTIVKLNKHLSSVLSEASGRATNDALPPRDSGGAESYRAYDRIPKKDLATNFSDKHNNDEPSLDRFSSKIPRPNDQSAVSTEEQRVVKSTVLDASNNLEVSDHRNPANKSLNLGDLVAFSKTFALNFPIPKDLMPLLAKDRAKQEQITKKQLETVAKRRGKLPIPRQSIADVAARERAEQEPKCKKQLGKHEKQLETAAKRKGLTADGVPRSPQETEINDPSTLFPTPPFSPAVTVSGSLDKTMINDSSTLLASFLRPSPDSAHLSTSSRSENYYTDKEHPLDALSGETTTVPHATSPLRPALDIEPSPVHLPAKNIIAGLEGARDAFPRQTIPLPPTIEAAASECGLGSTIHREFRRTDPPVLFEVLRDLGRGSMGVVEEVRLPFFPSFVRKKIILNLGREDRERWVNIIHQEVDVMKWLSHIHIVQAIGSYSIEPTTFAILMSPVGERNLKEFLDDMEYLQLDYVAGRNCDDYYETRGWLRKWPTCLANALAYIHSQGIRHEDIKPSNIVHKASEIYLTDFSSCSQFDVGGTTSTGAIARTTQLYQAPESFLSDKPGRHGLGTDVFSLGCVFLEMEAMYQADFHLRLQRLHGWRLKDLRSFCFGDPNKDRSTASIAAYSKALDRINEWFDIRPREPPPASGDTNPYEYFQRVIQPMLTVDRDFRPNAAAVCQLLLEIFPPACKCLGLVADQAPLHEILAAEYQLLGAHVLGVRQTEAHNWL